MPAGVDGLELVAAVSVRSRLRVDRRGVDVVAVGELCPDPDGGEDAFAVGPRGGRNLAGASDRLDRQVRDEGSPLLPADAPAGEGVAALAVVGQLGGGVEVFGKVVDGLIELGVAVRDGQRPVDVLERSGSGRLWDTEPGGGVADGGAEAGVCQPDDRAVVSTDWPS